MRWDQIQGQIGKMETPPRSVLVWKILLVHEIAEKEYSDKE